ncbi:S-adenosyl-l-methionine hydroxide adenosyltransferase family protein [Nitrospirota bacterium]
MITLTTDFGYVDPFVGMMKGVILGIAPESSIVDITHGITAHNIKEATISIASSHKYFPPGTIHVVVVDPGVGTERRPIIVSAHGQRFVGPDNGVFTGVIASDTGAKVYEITAIDYFLKTPGGISSTFHGRDVFSPVAAWLSKGKKPSDFGSIITEHTMLDLPSPTHKDGMITGEIIHIDTFGNAITNISINDIESLRKNTTIHVRFLDTEAGVVSCYAEGECTVPRTLINSSGQLEVFINSGNAAKLLNLSIGTPVTVSTK